ncbi:MAG: apolipoprotein N-acyltransferase [Candidatus Limnocylindria bacterium]
MRLLLALAGTLLSSVLFGLAFPPENIRPLAYVCLVPLLLALRSGSALRAVALAWLWAVASAWAIAPFFASSIASYYERQIWVGVGLGMLIFSVMASLYYMVFALIDRALARRFTLFSPLLTAAAWVAIELARGRLFTGSAFLIGNPWGLLGYTHASGSLAQVAAWTGVYGISFAIVAVNAGLAGWIGAARDPARSTRLATWGALLALLPAVGFALGGGLALRAAPSRSAGEGLLEVGVVQGSVPREHTWRSEYFARNLEHYLTLTRRALAEGAPITIVWPESAVNFQLETQVFERAAIAHVLREGGVELLVGGPGRGRNTQKPVFSSVFVIAPEGNITARYDKQFPLPFAEYFPFETDWLVRRRIDGALTFSPGAADPPPVDTRLGRAGLLLCNEAMLPELARARVRAGAEILISPSNDSWIAGQGFAEHMLAVVGLRAIEQRRYLVRASTSGPSAVVDPWGRVPVRTTPNRPEVLLGGVRPERELTVYARLGDLFAFSCAAVAALALLCKSWHPQRIS